MKEISDAEKYYLENSTMNSISEFKLDSKNKNLLVNLCRLLHDLGIEPAVEECGEFTYIHLITPITEGYSNQLHEKAKQKCQKI